MHKNFRKNRKTVRQILNHHFDRFGKCDRIKTLLQAGYEGIIWHGFCTVKADRGYLSDIFFRENEVEDLWRSI